MVVALLGVVAVIALLAGAHWYVWRRLFHDTTHPGSPLRRAGAIALCVLPALSVAALTSGRAGAPFWLEQVLAWPGFLWLAVLLYLVLWLLAGEAVRAGWLRWGRRGGRLVTPAPTQERAPTPTPEPAPTQEPAPTPAPAAAQGNPAASPDPAPAPAGGGVHAEGSVRTATPASSTLNPAALTAVPAASGVAAETVSVNPEPTTGPADPTVTPGTAPAGASTPGDRTTGTGAEDTARAGRGNPQLSRRVFVARTVGAGAAVGALATVGYGTHSVLRGPRLKRITVPLAKLPRSAHGLRIAVVSDIHLGPILGRGHTQRIVDTINSAQPDLVAIVGDMVDGSVADLGTAAEPLAGLEARHGSFFVTGNHEYYSGADEWVDHVRELGVRPLVNERVEIAAGFDLAGVNDPEGEATGDGPDFARALGDRDRARASVLLAHQPVVIHDAVAHGVDLQLSGHTHGGQLWPGRYLAELANPTVEGMERYGDTQLYVSRGAGAWGPPVRVGASSDITIVHLATR
ncbi:metallophosphoesterase [Streptomyces sp. NPDC057638]|uniref:metallophosphoesterase n=1 Tax=Streptomyces sp. NPDC057638 TaxID=3346190 RepID=UPI0036A3E011